jgi:hypothetical protein
VRGDNTTVAILKRTIHHHLNDTVETLAKDICPVKDLETVRKKRPITAVGTRTIVHDLERELKNQDIPKIIRNLTETNLDNEIIYVFDENFTRLPAPEEEINIPDLRKIEHKETETFNGHRDDNLIIFPPHQTCVIIVKSLDTGRENAANASTSSRHVLDHGTEIPTHQKIK